MPMASRHRDDGWPVGFKKKKRERKKGLSCSSSSVFIRCVQFSHMQYVHTYVLDIHRIYIENEPLQLHIDEIKCMSGNGIMSTGLVFSGKNGS